MFRFFKELLFCIVLSAAPLHADRTISCEEGRILSPLFKMLLENTEAGYVLYGKKPICTVAYSSYPFFFGDFKDSDPFDRLSVATHAAQTILKQPFFRSGNIVFHFDEKDELLLIINRNLFVKTIQENVSLFQYVLGPSVTAESLLNTLLSPHHAFCEVFNYDRVLIGIVLGYGAQNSLFNSRLENIENDGILTRDLPPFVPKATLSPDADNQSRLLFLSKSENPKWAKKCTTLKPSAGFSSLKEESEKLAKKMAISSTQLLSETPNFVFLCLKEESQLLFDLERTQKKIKKLLHSPVCLEKALGMIGQENINVQETKQALHVPHVDINLSKEHSDVALQQPHTAIANPMLSEELRACCKDAQNELEGQSCTPKTQVMDFLIAKLLKHELQGYEQYQLLSFAEGLLAEKNEHIIFSRYGASAPDAVNNIKTAKKNLEIADHFFASLTENSNYTRIFEHALYYQILANGSGPTLQEQKRVLLSFNIYDPNGNCLNFDTQNIEVKDTVPGFAHGIQGMKIGEKRKIYIHPSLAYGAHTYLEKGIYLEAVVTLHEISEEKGSLSPLMPTDLSFIRDDRFLEQCAKELGQTLRFRGKKKAEFLQQCPNISISSISKNFQMLDDQSPLSPEELNILNQYFWNLYFL